jgi:4-hydroxybenzoate polyprenyltransferase
MLGTILLIGGRMIKKLISLIKSTHPIPSFSVALFAVMFSWSLGVETNRIAVIGLAMLFQQFSVGLSNDWLDYERDLASGRKDKPSVTGQVRVSEIRLSAVLSAALALVISFLLNPAAGWLMVLMLIIGWAYNRGMKSNWSSAIPYALGFGTIPIFVGLSAGFQTEIPIWVVVAAMLLGVSAHFANALPDLVEDKANGVNALPHILGQRMSAVVIPITALAANFLVVTQSANLSTVAAVIGVVLATSFVGLASLLSLRPKPPRIVFPLLILASFVNVVLLVLGIAR